MDKFYKTITVDITDGNEYLDLVLNFCKNNLLKTETTYPSNDSVSEEAYIKISKSVDNEDVAFSKDELERLEMLEDYLNEDLEEEAELDNKILENTNIINQLKTIWTYKKQGEITGWIISIIILIFFLLMIILMNWVDETTSWFLNSFKSFIDSEITIWDIITYWITIIWIFISIWSMLSTEYNKDNISELQEELDTYNNQKKTIIMFK